MVKSALLLVPVVLALLAVPAFSGESQLKSGLWEVSRTMETRSGQTQLPSLRLCFDKPRGAFNFAPEQACTQTAASGDASGRTVETDCAPRTSLQVVVPIHLHQHFVPAAEVAHLVDAQQITGGGPGDRPIPRLRWVAADGGDVKPAPSSP